MSRFEVEYNFIETPRGSVPMNMKGFDTREKAEEFAKENDGKVVEYEAAWRITTTGKKVRIW